MSVWLKQTFKLCRSQPDQMMQIEQSRAEEKLDVIRPKEASRETS